MKLFKVVGNVTLSSCHPSFHAAKLLAVEPNGAQVLGTPASAEPELLIVWDEQGAGEGAQIAVSDGAEAAQAFRPELKPVDAYCSAILDAIHIDPQAVDDLISKHKTQ